MSISVCVVMYYTPNMHDFQIMGQAAETNRREYCQKHGYAIDVTTKKHTKTRDAYWAKIQVVMAAMRNNPRSDWLFWTDCDALITDLNYSLADLIRNKLSANPRLFLIVSNDIFGLNSGHFLIKNCPQAYRYLQHVQSLAKRPDILRYRFPEQKAMQCVIEEDHLQNQVLFVPQRVFNSFPVAGAGKRWYPGDFVIHFAGIRRSRAAQQVAKYQKCPQALIQKYIYLDVFWYASLFLVPFLWTGLECRLPPWSLVMTIVILQAAYFGACVYW